MTETGSFYRGRKRTYGVLMLFVVVVGLPMAAVPSLRNRLLERVWTLKAAAAGDVKPASLKVGEYQEPFPAEFEKPAPPASSPAQSSVIDKVYSMTPGVYAPPAAPSRARSARQTAKAAGSARVIIIEPEPPDAPETQPSGEAELPYRTGAIERQAYDLVVESNPALAAMIQGSNPSLRFKSWDAASRGEDIYWVRITFQSEGNPDVEYIWQVKLDTKQVTPLSYNARTLS